MSRARRNKLKVRHRSKRRVVLISLLAVFLLIIGLLAFSAILGFTSLTSDLPSLEKQAVRPSALTTKVYAADGTFLADLHAEENRVVIPLSDVPLQLQQAVIAIEDERFYDHKGVDLEGIARAIVVNLETGWGSEGASTITQQYVRNVMLTPEKTMKRKIKEAVLAYQVEQKYSKKVILEKYLNTVYFGQGCYGVETASETFFGKKAADLTLTESALLAGVVRSPNRDNPYANLEAAMKRRDVVLNKMVELKYITKAQAEEAKKVPTEIKPIQQQVIPAPYFVEYVKQLLIDKYGANTVFKGGLRIYTTVDLRMQQAAEEAAWTILDRANDPAATLVAIEPKTGYIKAMVGGKDFNAQKLNLAVQGHRQAGSAFKIFVLVAAIEQGISPSKVYGAGAITIQLPGRDWHVENAEPSEGGAMTIRAGTIHSVNCLYARLVMDVGPKNVVEMAKKMGIVSPLDPVPSIALGGLRIGVNALEMASAYGTVANEGKYTPPIGVIKVTDSDGKVLEENKPDPKQVISPATTFLVSDILQDVIRMGTGRRANIGRPAAGKTGTAQSYRDAWFCGYTPDLACAVWVGYPQGQIAMRSVHGTRVFGGTFPAQIWARFMRKALENTPPTQFAAAPAGVVRVRICADTGLLPTKFCPNVTSGVFVKGQAPNKRCELHKGIRVPGLIGRSAYDAERVLAESGLVMGRIDQPNSGVPVGQVFSQSPDEGAEVATGSTVTVYVSTGAPPEPPPPPTTSSTPSG